MSYRRIVCLCAGSVEALYLLGAEDQIVGISGFTFEPRRARTEKPKVSGFRTANIDAILALKPDLVIAFSHVQNEIVHALIKSGVEVHVFNHIDVAGILHMVRSLAALTARHEEGHRLLASLNAEIQETQEKAACAARKPKIFFEYKSDPLTTGVAWVSDLIEIAGGEDCFAGIARNRFYQDRAVGNEAEVVKRAPDIIFGSWSRLGISTAQVAQRTGWSSIPAVRENRLIEIRTGDFFVPGPGVIIRGLKRVRSAVEEWASTAGPLTRCT